MIQPFKEFGHSRKIRSLAKMVAEQSVEGVCQRIAGHTTLMTTSETRGFIRARAARVIRRQARLLLSRQKDAQENWTRQTVCRATEQVIPLVLRQLSQSNSRASAARTAA